MINTDYNVKKTGASNDLEYKGACQQKAGKYYVDRIRKHRRNVLPTKYFNKYNYESDWKPQVLFGAVIPSLFVIWDFSSNQIKRVGGVRMSFTKADLSFSSYYN